MKKPIIYLITLSSLTTYFWLNLLHKTKVTSHISPVITEEKDSLEVKVLKSPAINLSKPMKEPSFSETNYYLKSCTDPEPSYNLHNE